MGVGEGGGLEGGGTGEGGDWKGGKEGIYTVPVQLEFQLYSSPPHEIETSLFSVSVLSFPSRRMKSMLVTWRRGLPDTSPSHQRISRNFRPR
jgi:hypothetical protein